MRLGLGLGLFKAGAISAGVRIFSAFQTRVIGDGGTVEAGTCVVNGLNNSSILQRASLLLIPSGYKGGKLYAEIPTNGNGDLTWTRTSTAIRTNSSGVLESMATGVPRISYMYGSCPSALLEPQRTNFILRSEEFDNASWTKPFGWTVNANATTSPDGTSNADLITPTNFNNVSQSCVVTTSTNYAISIYVKRNTTNSTWVSLIFSGGTSISYGYVINWSTLSISLIPVRTAATNPTFESVGNGWYRISFVCASGNNTSASLQIIPDSQAGTNSIYIYGAQLEAGAYPTTYIPTTSATATRVADSFSRNNIYTNGLISASGGTWFVELRNNVAYTRDGFGALYLGTQSLTTSTTGDGLYIRRNDLSSNRLSIQSYISGVASALYLTATDTVKIALKWNGTSVDVFVNGTKQVSASAFTPTAMEFLGHTTIVDVPKFIQQMALFPTPLTDAQCQTLTT